jgi:hypothetical protein
VINSSRGITMIISEILNEDIRANDVFFIETKDTIIETIVESVTDDGIVISLDEHAMTLLSESGWFNPVKKFMDKRAAAMAMESAGYLAAIHYVSRSWEQVLNVLDDRELETLQKNLKITTESPEWSKNKYFLKGWNEGLNAGKSSEYYNKMIVNKFKNLDKTAKYLEYSLSDLNESIDVLPENLIPVDEASVFKSISNFFDKRAQASAMESMGYIIGVYYASGKKWQYVQLFLDHGDWDILEKALKLTTESPEWRKNTNLIKGWKSGAEAYNTNDVFLGKMISSKMNRIKSSMHYLGLNKLDEAEYQGRKVTLGKPFLTPDGPKKRSVYVKNPKGNVVKVNFGDKNMKIKKSNPARRKSFRARHNCANPGPKWRARYWSCRAW